MMACEISVRARVWEVKRKRGLADGADLTPNKPVLSHG